MAGLKRPSKITQNVAPSSALFPVQASFPQDMKECQHHGISFPWASSPMVSALSRTTSTCHMFFQNLVLAPLCFQIQTQSIVRVCLNTSKPGMDLTLSPSSSHNGEMLGYLLMERTGGRWYHFPQVRIQTYLISVQLVNIPSDVLEQTLRKWFLFLTPRSCALLGERGIVGSKETFNFFSSLMQMSLPIIYVPSLEKLASPIAFFLKSLWRLCCSPSH